MTGPRIKTFWHLLVDLAILPHFTPFYNQLAKCLKMPPTCSTRRQIKNGRFDTNFYGRRHSTNKRRWTDRNRLRWFGVLERTLSKPRGCLWLVLHVYFWNFMKKISVRMGISSWFSPNLNNNERGCNLFCYLKFRIVCEFN